MYAYTNIEAPKGSERYRKEILVGLILRELQGQEKLVRERNYGKKEENK